MTHRVRMVWKVPSVVKEGAKAAVLEDSDSVDGADGGAEGAKRGGLWREGRHWEQGDIMIVSCDLTG